MSKLMLDYVQKSSCEALLKLMILPIFISAYFKHPQLICSPVASKGVSPGRGLYIQMGHNPENEYLHIPKEERYLAPMWTKGNCLPMMGWYTVSSVLLLQIWTRFGVWNRMCNSFLLVLEHCIFTYITEIWLTEERLQLGLSAPVCLNNVDKPKLISVNQVLCYFSEFQGGGASVVVYYYCVSAFLFVFEVLFIWAVSWDYGTFHPP